ncbi:MAG: YcgN family cysteine cluster protein [Methylomonas sp.]|jgi:uncharacterized cysteine cluster protein YcgN (CxxCxxCC family)
MKFWETKKLADMNYEEWESLCDRCGQCCLHKLEDADSGELAFTSVVCDLYDLQNSRCSCYAERCTRVPDCVDLKKHDFAAYNWMPSTCAYRLLMDGKPLPDWHPLITGNPLSVMEAGAAISGFAIKESEVDDLEDYIIEWRI